MLSALFWLLQQVYWHALLNKAIKIYKRLVKLFSFSLDEKETKGSLHISVG